MILTHEHYLEMGGAIADAALFARLSARAEGMLHRLTHGRMRDEDPARPCAQYAAYALIEAMRADEQMDAGGREIASMSNDGVSVSYAVEGDAQRARARRYEGIVREYLAYEYDRHGTALLYAGCER